MKKTCQSYGLAICSNNKNITGYEKPCVLLVQRRFTYEFNEFVFGNYKWEELPEYFNGMTSSEKIEILLFDISKLWYRISLNTNVPEWVAAKFAAVVKNKAQIVEMIQNSRDSFLIWELPKGRQKLGEDSFETAAREIEEEIHISKKKYCILYTESPVVLKNEAFGIIYKMTFYLAEYIAEKYACNFRHKQMREIECIKWWPVDSLEYICPVAFRAGEKYLSYVGIKKVS